MPRLLELLQLPLQAQEQLQLWFDMSVTKRVQYLCAVILIVTSVMMVGYQVFTIQDVANGLLMYVAQAFLLVASIFGLDYYIDKIKSASGR